MNMNEKEATRAKMLGVLIRDARLHAGRSLTDCAQVLNISRETFEKAERGEHPVSLPDLEALSIYLKVPMGHFWGSETLDKESQVDYGSFMALRHRVVGVLLRQLRLQARRSVQEVAEVLNVSEEQIDAYEAGEAVIPYVHLEQLSRYLDVPINYFLDNQRGPLGRHEAEQKLQKLFNQLPPDMQAFIVNPSNRSYLETAKRLSEMDVQRLRQVAESILDITF